MAPHDMALNYNSEAMELMMSPIEVETFSTVVARRRKRVQILEEPQVFALIMPFCEMSAEQRLQVWWQKDEYESSKKAAKNKCREIRKLGAHKGTLTGAYDEAKAAPFDLFNFDVRMTYESKLVHWCNDNESPRGLERWASKTHGFLRGKDVNEARHAVLLEQSRQFLIDSRDEEEIARVAQRTSKQSRAFARLLGAADAVVASGTFVYSTKRKQSSDIEEMSNLSRKISRVSPPNSPTSSDGEDMLRIIPSFVIDLYDQNVVDG